MIDSSKPFQFNQGNLQDFNECRRRFYLRYIQQLAWPAAEAEPIMENELWMRQGSVFHHMVHQYFMGVPEELLSNQANAEPLKSWWENFQDRRATLNGVEGVDSVRIPEFSLSAHIGKFSITAKFDLLVILPDKSILIYDWKTARHKPKHNFLEQRLQTLVYPVVASLCSSELLQSPDIKPPQISMNYWFTEFPDQPEIFVFDQDHLKKNHKKIESLMSTITRLISEGEVGFPLTENHKTCTFCVYRSLCDRGVHAGSFSEADPDEEIAELSLDFEQIGEVEF